MDHPAVADPGVGVVCTVANLGLGPVVHGAGRHSHLVTPPVPRSYLEDGVGPEAEAVHTAEDEATDLMARIRRLEEQLRELQRSREAENRESELNPDQFQPRLSWFELEGGPPSALKPTINWTGQV